MRERPHPHGMRPRHRCLSLSAGCASLPVRIDHCYRNGEPFIGRRLGHLRAQRWTAAGRCSDAQGADPEDRRLRAASKHSGGYCKFGCQPRNFPETEFGGSNRYALGKLMSRGSQTASGNAPEPSSAVKRAAGWPCPEVQLKKSAATIIGFAVCMGLYL